MRQVDDKKIQAHLLWQYNEIEENRRLAQAATKRGDSESANYYSGRRAALIEDNMRLREALNVSK